MYIIPVFGSGNNNPLPIYLISFSGKASASDNVLNWSTSQEVNSKQIEIERSINGADFVKVGIVSARGNSSSRSEYTYTDKNVKAVNHYYRLKLVDVDGKFSYSNIIVIKRDNLLMSVNRIMPNPFKDKVEIELLAENNNETVLTLYDMSGKLVKTMQVKTTKGINRILVNDLGGLGSGTYILNIKNNDGEIKTKLLKINF